MLRVENRVGGGGTCNSLIDTQVTPLEDKRNPKHSLGPAPCWPGCGPSGLEGPLQFPLSHLLAYHTHRDSGAGCVGAIARRRERSQRPTASIRPETQARCSEATRSHQSPNSQGVREATDHSQDRGWGSISVISKGPPSEGGKVKDFQAGTSLFCCFP